MTPQDIVKTEATSFELSRINIETIHEAITANLGQNSINLADFTKVKIPSGGGTTWAVSTLEGEETVRDLTGIIVSWRDTRCYWATPMEQSDGNRPPECASSDARVGFGNPGGNCASCSLAQFGSGPNGGQACKIIRQLFLLREGDMLPVIVNLPPTSAQPVRQYFSKLLMKKLRFYDIITKISLEKTKNTQGIAFSRAAFTSCGLLSTEQALYVARYVAMFKPLLDSAPGERTATETDGEVI